jgi:hypothetical protein
MVLRSFSHRFRINAFVFVLGVLAAPSGAPAQGAAPALYGVHDIILHNTHFLYPQAADSCALLADNLAATIDGVMLDLKVPVTLASVAKPPQFGTSRIELMPEVATMNSEGLDCTSWVSLSAQSQTNVKIMPVETLRNVTVIYWHKGVLVNSGQSGHAAIVDGVLKKFAVQFAQDYKAAQP